MIVRLHFVVEGQTEEAFVNSVLGPHLGAFGISPDARQVYTSRDGVHWHRGGVTKYLRIRNDLVWWMQQDHNPDAWFTTMFDYYKLPKDFPGRDQLRPGMSPANAVACLEGAFAMDIEHKRFVPYIQLHEFEALILADPTRLATMYPGAQPGALRTLAKEVAEAGGPEVVDLENPPSKRIRQVVPSYNKIAAGVQVTQAVGLVAIRGSCSHFDSWVKRMEGLPTE